MLPTAIDGSSLWRQLRSGIRCWFRLQAMNVKSTASYAADAWIEMVLFVGMQATGLVFLWVVFTKVKAMGGWTLPQAAFLYGLLIMSLGVYRLGFQGVRDTGFLILNGALDQLLTRPRSLLLLLSCRRSNLNGAGDLMTGLALVLIAASEMDYTWTVARVGQLALYVVTGNAIMIAIMMGQAAACFWLVRFTVLHDLVMALREYCLYPLTIYGKPVRALLSTALPLAFCSYYPAAVLLGKDGLSSWWVCGPPLVATACVAVAIGLFHAGRRAYESTGS